MTTVSVTVGISSSSYSFIYAMTERMPYTKQLASVAFMSLLVTHGYY